VVQSFVGLCNFFQTHIKDFAIIALFKVTRKDSGYKNGPLPQDALHTLKVFQQLLTSEPVKAFPRSDRKYALITEAATGTADCTGGLGAILTQMDEHGNHFAISFASRQLKDHELNYSPFLLEAATAVWGMDVFIEYLRDKQFILFTGHKPIENWATCTQQCSTICKQLYWSTISLFNIKKVQIWQQIIYPDSHPYPSAQLVTFQHSLLLTHSNLTCKNSNVKIRICKQFQILKTRRMAR